MAPRTNGASTGDGAGSGAGAADATVEGRNLWDFLSVAVVVAGLVGLTIFLVEIYTKSPKTTISIIGIVVPALAAVFGVTVGYAGGNLKRQATGKKAAKQQLSSKVQELISATAPPSDGAGDTGAAARYNGATVTIQPSNEATQGPANVREGLQRLQGYVDAL